MELNVEKQIIRQSVDVKTEHIEHSIDGELLLPDICPDIARILKCKCLPKITKKQLTEELLTVEGSVGVWLLYVDEQGTVCTCEQRFPLFREVAVPQKVKYATVTVKTDYCNCRAISGRKVELHGAVTLRAVLHTLEEIPVVTGVTGNGSQILSQPERVTLSQWYGEKQFTVNDEIQIASGSIRSILRSQGVIREAECKTIAGKVIVKAVLELSGLYRDMDGGFACLRAQLPFVQTVDVEGAQEDFDCRVTFELTEIDLRVRTGLDGECKTVMVSAGIRAWVEVCQTDSVTLVTDGYSTRCGLGIRRYTGNLQRLSQMISEEYLCKKQLELSGQLRSILDTWCEASVEQVVHQNNILRIGGTLTVMTLAVDADGVASYIEKGLDYLWEHPLPGEGLIIQNPVVTVQGCTYTFSGESTLDLRMELQISAGVFEPVYFNAITDVTAELGAVPPAAPAPLVLYFAREGERLFDIARRYNTTCDAIFAANNISEMVLPEGKALLIPTA